MVGFVVLSSLANIALGYALAVYLQGEGVAPFRSWRWRGFWPRWRRTGLAASTEPAYALTTETQQRPAAGLAAARSPAAERLSPAFSGAPLGDLTPVGTPPSMPLISPFAAPAAVDEPLAATAESSPFAATMQQPPLADALPSVATAASGQPDPAPETPGQEPVAESQVLAGIEAFRAQLAEMKQQSVAAAE